METLSPGQSETSFVEVPLSGSLVANTQSEEAKHPPSFYCPLSKQCMRDPVVLSDGYTYERLHIEKWLASNDTSPISGDQLSQKNLFPNHALKNTIKEYFEQILSSHRQAIQKSIMSAPVASQSHASSTLRRTIDALMKCALLIHEDLDPESVLRQVMDEAKALVGAEVASVFLHDLASAELYSTVNSTEGELRIPDKLGIAGYVARTAEAVIIHDAYSDTRFNSSVDVKTGLKTRNLMCVPLISKVCGVIGVAQLINKTSYSMLRDEHDELKFTTADLQFLKVFASQVAVTITNSGHFSMCDVRRMPDYPPKDWSIWTYVQDLCFGRYRGDARETDERVTESRAEHEFIRPVISGNASVSIDVTDNPVLAEFLDQAFEGWEIDARILAQLTNNRPLSTLLCYLFDRLGLVESFKLDRAKLVKFATKIEDGYFASPLYHNRCHAATVVHSMYALMEHGQLIQVVTGGVGDGQFERMVCLLSAAVHDYEHHGLSNEFLIKTSHDRALRYNDKHVNENHHAAASLTVMRQPDYDFLGNLSREDTGRLRSMIVDLVLSTDMADGAAILNGFTQLLDAKSHGSDATAGYEFTTVEEKLQLLRIAMKSVDIGHLALTWDLHLYWVKNLEEEMFIQGDKEKDIGIYPVSFLMDRDKPGASQTQVGFFKFVVLPLFRALERAVPAAKPLVSAVEANNKRWCDLEAAQEAAKSK